MEGLCRQDGIYTICTRHPKNAWRTDLTNGKNCRKRIGKGSNHAQFLLEQTRRSHLADLQQFFTGKLYVVVYQLKLPAEELLWLALSWHIRGDNPEVKALWVKARILPDG